MKKIYELPDWDYFDPPALSFNVVIVCNVLNLDFESDISLAGCLDL